MKILVSTTVLAAVLVLAFRPSLRGARRSGELAGLWAYLAAVGREWPDRELVLEVYRSSRDDGFTSSPWAQPVGQTEHPTHQQPEFATEAASPHGG